MALFFREYLGAAMMVRVRFSKQPILILIRKVYRRRLRNGLTITMKNRNFGLIIALAVGVGVAVGVSLEDMALGLGVGVAIAITMGVFQVGRSRE